MSDNVEMIIKISNIDKEQKEAIEDLMAQWMWQSSKEYKEKYNENKILWLCFQPKKELQPKIEIDGEDAEFHEYFYEAPLYGVEASEAFWQTPKN